MLYSTAIVAASAASLVQAAGCPFGHEWQAPEPTDHRAPCPMLNALANHGYLPRSGANVSVDEFVAGLDAGINLDHDATLFVVSVGLLASTTGYNNTLNLDDLKLHNLIEHDASLSRGDAFSGDNLHFNPAIWATTAAHFTQDQVDIPTAALARRDRIAAAQAANPQFNLTAQLASNSLVETASYLKVLGKGDGANLTVSTEWLKIFFEQQRLPFEEGFTRSETVITQDDLTAVAVLVATS